MSVTLHEVHADGVSVQPIARVQGDFVALRATFDHRLELHVTPDVDANFVVQLHPTHGSARNYPVRTKGPGALGGTRYLCPVVVDEPFDGEVWIAAVGAPRGDVQEEAR